MVYRFVIIFNDVLANINVELRKKHMCVSLAVTLFCVPTPNTTCFNNYKLYFFVNAIINYSEPFFGF